MLTETQKIEAELEARKRDLAKAEGTVEQVEATWMSNFQANDVETAKEILRNTEEQFSSIESQQTELLNKAREILQKA